MLKLATKSRAKEIMRIFSSHKPWTEHIRQDYVVRMIEAGNVYFCYGVVLVFLQYKKKTQMAEGTFAVRGDYAIQQIAASVDTQGTGATKRVLDAFCGSLPAGASLFLKVRSDNKRAIAFYKKSGFVVVGKVQWTKQGFPLPGLVMCLVGKGRLWTG